MSRSAAFVRAGASIERMAVMVAQLMGMHDQVWVRWDAEAKGWRCERVSHEVWFGDPFFSVSEGGVLAAGIAYGPWSTDGAFVRLKTLDGEWVWRLTGEVSSTSNIDGPLTTRRAVWPD